MCVRMLHFASFCLLLTSVSGEVGSVSIHEDVSFRGILYNMNYAGGRFLKKFFESSDLVEILGTDVEVWFLILGIFFSISDYHAGAVLTYFCRTFSGECSSEVLPLVRKAVVGGVGNRSALLKLVDRVDLTNLTEIDKVFLWLNGEKDFEFSDPHVLLGTVRRVVYLEYATNGFICLRRLEKEKSDSGHSLLIDELWIGGGELRTEGFRSDEIWNCMQKPQTEAFLYNVALDIGSVAPQGRVLKTFETQFRDSVYRQRLARLELGSLFLQYAYSAKEILAETLYESVSVDAFLWQFVFSFVFKQTGRGTLTARLVGGADKRRDSDNMAQLLVVWATQQTAGPWWNALLEQWQNVYAGTSIQWDKISDYESVLLWINGAQLPRERRINDKLILIRILDKIVTEQIHKNGSICQHVLQIQNNIKPKPGFDWDGVVGEDILECQKHAQKSITTNPVFLTNISNALADKYLTADLF